MRNVFFLFSLLLFCTPAMAQVDQSPEELLDNGFFFFQEEDYEEAIYYLLRLEDTPYFNANVHFRIGMCYLHIPGEEHKAIPYFEKAIENLTGKYSARSTKETKAPYHTWFYLGRAYRINNELEKALEAFYAFREVPGFDRNYNIRIVENEIRACEIAKIIKDIPLNVNIVNLGSPVNDASDNYQPVISSNEQTLVYMTDLKFYNALFMSKKLAGIWTEPVNITPQVESDGDAIPVWISPNGEKLLLIKGTGNKRDIYISTYSAGSWSRMEPFPGPVNSNRAESFASLSDDEKTLYFSSNRRGGMGEFDIYRSVLDQSGQWSEPENLGDVINTPFNEASPHLSEDGNTLYFSSEGHYNMGGYDIFYSTRGPSGQWQDPINIGYPVNTTSDETFFYPVRNGKFVYLSRNMPEGFGQQDIYRIEIIPEETSGTMPVSGELDADWNCETPFIIKLIDRNTEEILTEFLFDPDSKKINYKSNSKNLKVLIEKHN